MSLYKSLSFSMRICFVVLTIYKEDGYIKNYSTWNQSLTLIFGQLSRSFSLLECIITLQAHSGKVNDINAMGVPYEVGSFYIFNRGYNDYSRLYAIHKIGVTFIVRAKKNILYINVFLGKDD